MWITGNDAVNRYDGSRVKVYNLNKYFNKCPNLQQGYGFAEDNLGTLYIGSVNGLYVYHRDEDNFTLVKIYAGNDQTAMPIVFKNGKIWCYNKQYKLASYDVKNQKVEYIASLPLPAMKSIHIYDLNLDIFYYRYPFLADNTLWFIDTEQVLCFNINNKKISFPLKSINNKEYLKFYSATYNATSKSVFLGCINKIIKYNIKKDEISEYLLDLNNKPVKREVTSITTNKNLIVYTQNSDTFICDSTFNNTQNITNYFSEANQPFQLNFDKNDRLWLCKDGLGQYILDFKPPLIFKETAENKKLEAIIKYGVIGFGEFPNKDVLINEAIVKSHRDNDYKIEFQAQKFSGYRNANDPYRKGIWQFSTRVNRTSIISFIDQNKKRKFIKNFSSNLGLGTLQDLQVLDNHSILCSFQSGLYWFDLAKLALMKIPNQKQENCFKINKLSNNRLAISYLVNDMWLAEVTNDNKLTFIKRILPKQQSFYVQEDVIKNQFWVGTNNGIFLLDKNFEIIKKFDANNGLAGSYIYGLLLDNQGNAWCSHQHGLSSINANNFQIINYNKADGIQDWDFNNRAFYKATDGTLFFGGVKGFNYFKPPLSRKSYYKPEIYIDEITVNAIPIKTDKWVNTLKKINLKARENNLSFFAVINDLENAASQNILYRLNKSKWNIIKNPNYINFSSLAPGNYCLELATHNKFTNKTTIQKTIEITIENPFYQTIWFWSLITFAISTLVYINFNNQKLKKQQSLFQQQLALEQQRNKMTADLHDDIGATLSSLQLNSAIANQLIQKDVSLAQILIEKVEDQSKELADKIGDIIWSMKPGKDEFLTMSSRIKNFVNDILGSTNINYKIKIDENTDEMVNNIIARKNIVLFIKEATNNIAKYSKADFVEIKLNITEQVLYIEISDNGVGFDTSNAIGNGIGNMKKRIDELNGQFSIFSEIKKGTIIKASVPLSLN